MPHFFFSISFHSFGTIVRVRKLLMTSMVRCGAKGHLVSIDEMIFCPVEDLGLPSHKNPGRFQRRLCRKHFLSLLESQRRHNQKPHRKESSAAWLRDYRKTDKSKAWHRTPKRLKERRITSMKQQARTRGISYELSPEKEAEIVAEDAVCYHCGRQNQPHQRGLYKASSSTTEDMVTPLGPDRLDPDGVYTDDNVVSACSQCNLCRGKLSLSDFRTACENMVLYTDLGIPCHRRVEVSVQSGGARANSCSYAECKQRAKEKEWVFELTPDDHAHITSGPCAYCGDRSSARGIDRLDSDKGYTRANVRACCSVCNYVKRHYSCGDFHEMCRAVYRSQGRFMSHDGKRKVFRL